MINKAIGSLREMENTAKHTRNTMHSGSQRSVHGWRIIDMKQYNKKPEPTVECCSTCASRPRGAEKFVCPVIHRIMFDSMRTGCVNWTEAKA